MRRYRAEAVSHATRPCFWCDQSGMKGIEAIPEFGECPQCNGAGFLLDPDPAAWGSHTFWRRRDARRWVTDVEIGSGKLGAVTFSRIVDTWRPATVYEWPPAEAPQPRYHEQMGPA